MASVRKLDPKDPKSKWIVEYTGPDGKRHRKTPKSGLKKDAEALRQKIEREMGDDAHVPDSATITFRELGALYEKHMDRRFKDGGIGRSYRELIEQSLRIMANPIIGSTLLTKITREDIEKVVDVARERGSAPRTIKIRLDTISSVFAFGIERGLMKKNPVCSIIKDRRSIVTRPIRTFNKEQVAAVLSVAHRNMDGRYSNDACINAIINVAALCGLRLGEILALKPDHVDFVNGVIKVRENLTTHNVRKGPKTRSGVRDVPMPLQVAQLLRHFLVEYHIRGRDLPLLHGEDGAFWRRTNLHARWQTLLKRAGIQRDPVEGFHHFHALRHFAGSLMIESGYSVVEVSNILGHSHFDITLQTYVHPLATGSRRIEVAQR